MNWRECTITTEEMNKLELGNGDLNEVAATLKEGALIEALASALIEKLRPTLMRKDFDLGRPIRAYQVPHRHELVLSQRSQ